MQEIVLLPAQQAAFDTLSRASKDFTVLVLSGRAGSGRTLIARELARTPGAVTIQASDIVAAIHSCGEPMMIEEAFVECVYRMGAEHNRIILDDFSLLHDVVAVCGMSFYPRNNWIQSALAALFVWAAAGHRQILFICDRNVPEAIEKRAFIARIARFEPADYAALGGSLLGEAAHDLNWNEIHRFAPKLNGHQIRSACLELEGSQSITTNAFIEQLRARQLGSNVDLPEVEAVDLRKLRGMDDLVEALEAQVVMPLERDDLASELNLKPKRGVLLAGPPGTGKTTIGRALAHRLKGKFFLLDGNVITGTTQFFSHVRAIFEAAKENAPSVVFIDDSDVIFEDGTESGFYRYLLTQLDGLESASSGRVCVMMTAMDISRIPPALVRSGRVELWLETRLPDAGARADIYRDLAANQPDAVRLSPEAAAELTDGLTGADIKRLVEDSRILYAYDRANDRPLRAPGEYFAAATATVRTNKEKYAAAEAVAAHTGPRSAPWFSMFRHMTAAGVDDDDD